MRIADLLSIQHGPNLAHYSGKHEKLTMVSTKMLDNTTVFNTVN